MKTLIKGGWIVGWSGDEHEILLDGVCVVEHDRILHVGHSYDGPVDNIIDATGQLVVPGMISTHIHAGNNSSNYVFLDRGRPEAQARNYLNWQAGVRGAPRYRPDARRSATYGLSQCLRSGATTVLEVGCAGNPSAFVEAVDQLGVRVFTGPSYRNVIIWSSEDGRLEYDWSEERGDRGLEKALAFVDEFDGAAGGRISAVLCPGHTDTCSKRLLTDTASLAAERNLPVTIHAAINPREMEYTLDTYRLTPIELLAEVGLLGPHVVLGHCLFLSEHSWSRYHHAPDLKLLGEYGATVSHSPLKYMHMGVHLESLQRYIASGANITVGTDFTPADILVEMRSMMLMSRVADRNFLSGTPRDVFDAATVNAANALNREDLGRLTKGAKADLAIFDMRQVHIGAVRDPIKSLVENANGSDASLVMVDGKVVVEDGTITTVDERELLLGVQEDANKMLDDLPNWMWDARTAEDAVPPAYRISSKA